MISKNEINKLALEQKVRTTTIDKDWVLGHFIDAIYTIPECRNNLIFKGGTCLKKCRFPSYRFSEDLDFTAISDNFVFDMTMLKKIVGLVAERTEMLLHVQSLEKMLFSPEIANVIHNYSDKLTENAQNIPIYSINEVLAEKIRALIQRSYTAPRDYFDIWYLSKHVETIDWKEIVKGFSKKVEYKNLQFSGVEQLINENNDKILKSAWINSLEHQIESGKLPKYEIVRNDLKILFEKIFKDK